MRARWRRDRGWLAPLLVLFIAKGIVLANVIGPFTGHDEVDHFFYIQRLANGGGLGEFRTVLLPPEAAPYQDFVADFPYNAEVIQPPLYHLALAPLYSLLPGGLFAKLFGLRLVSVALGALAVLASYALAAELYPDEIAVRAGTPIFVALQPQFSFEAAIVNHDILVILLATIFVWLLIVWLRRGYDPRRRIWLGVLAGAGIMTKTSFGLMLPVLALALLLDNRRRCVPPKRVLRDVAAPFVVTLAIVAPWFARSIWLYGDPTGAQELARIPDYGEQSMSVSDMLTSPVFWRGRLEDFWGNYGWRLIPFDPGTYRGIYAVWGIAGLGLLALLVKWMIRIARGERPSPWDSARLAGLAICALWILVMVGGVIYIGTIQFTQSRFAFPAMAAFGLLTSLGYARLLPRRLGWLVPPLMLVALVALNVLTMVRFVLPFYAGSGGRPGVMP